MKKLFFIAAIAGVALVSCTKNEVAPIAQQDEITFVTPVVGPQTKVQYGEIDVNYNEAEHFGVYAVHTPGDLDTWGAGTLYMGVEDGAGLKCVYKTNYWAPEKPYYWPKEGKLSFAAYSPFEVSGTVKYDEAGLSVAGHTVSNNTAEHVDFMYAPRVYNRNSSTEEGDDDNLKYEYDGVNILFEHAMSSIVFKVARKTGIDSNTEITLNKITLTKPYLKADFNETITDGATYDAAPKWSNWDSATDVVAYEPATGAILTEDLVEYVNNTDDDIILIPQTLTDEVKVVLEYTIKNPGNHEVDQVSEIQLNTHTASWGIGTRYTYNITIGLDEIIFDPAVTEWKDATGVAITF